MTNIYPFFFYPLSPWQYHSTFCFYEFNVFKFRIWDQQYLSFCIFHWVSLRWCFDFFLRQFVDLHFFRTGYWNLLVSFSGVMFALFFVLCEPCVDACGFEGANTSSSFSGMVSAAGRNFPSGPCADNIVSRITVEQIRAGSNLWNLKLGPCYQGLKWVWVTDGPWVDKTTFRTWLVGLALGQRSTLGSTDGGPVTMCADGYDSFLVSGRASDRSLVEFLDEQDWTCTVSEGDRIEPLLCFRVYSKE